MRKPCYWLAAATAALSLCVCAGASDPNALGNIQGVTRNPTGEPLANATVTIHSVDEKSDRTLTCGGDGSFFVDHLKPEKYRLTAKTEEFVNRNASVVDLEPGRVAKVEMRLVETAAATPPLTDREKQLLDRIDRLEARLAAIEARDANAMQVAAVTPLGTESLVASLKPVAVFPQTGLPLSGSAPSPQSTAAPAPVTPEALQAPDPSPAVDTFTPFAFGDFTWLNGSPRNKDAVLDTKFFTPEVRFDTHFMVDFNQPVDHTIGGGTESFRSGEFQLEQVSVGGDFHWQNVRGRILTMNGLFATTTPRNDGSAGVGQWDVRGAYKYVSEAYGGYHFDVSHGLNIDAGIFVSYIGLFSYYNFDNWTYQPSFVSSNTRWFFNGLRVQWFPTNKLKIEPWVINGWQSYNRFNGHRGLGGQILWQPKEWVKLVFNNYGNGTDTLGVPGRSRFHTDDSILVRYYNHPESTGISKMAFTLTGDAGCEYGAGVTCHGGKGGPKQSFLGWMLYNRVWWDKDQFAVTLGGGVMNNPGRYLTLLPPINGADAISGSPYFTANAGDNSHMWDASATFHWMPKQYITWWLEAGYRHADIPYWTGRGGITPPGGNTSAPSQYVCAGGGTAGTSNLAVAETACGGGLGSVWFPDLRRGQAMLSAGVMVKF